MLVDWCDWNITPQSFLQVRGFSCSSIMYVHRFCMYCLLQRIRQVGELSPWLLFPSSCFISSAFYILFSVIMISFFYSVLKPFHLLSSVTFFPSQWSLWFPLHISKPLLGINCRVELKQKSKPAQRLRGLRNNNNNKLLLFCSN